MASKTDGFVSIPNWLYDDSSLSLHEFMVYAVLLRFRDHKTGKCFPGMSTIADRARMSRKSVERAIASLEQRGMIRVERRSTLRENKPNIYHVALATETPAFVWASSARGKRIPKRPRTTDSESVVAGVDPVPTDSESVPTDSQSLPPQTPSRPNKNHENKTQEQTLRQGQETPRAMFSFDAQQELATPKQLDYLNDLHIFLTERIPDARTQQKWEALPSHEASALIDTYWQQIDRGRGGMWESAVNEQHPAYPHLSAKGKQWIYNGCVPELKGAA